MIKYTFQVNLGGIIDILANHLYSDDSVFVRELLQNATDAITARYKTDTSFSPQIEIELINHKDSPSQISISDNGIGLTEKEIHIFLSVIGASSKKDELLKKRKDFIGQFGIGLLSCFVAAENIVLITKSVTEAKPVKWIGNSDGTYTISVLDLDYEPGTRIYLTAKKDSEEYFTYDILKELIHRYANFLPFPIYLIGNQQQKLLINDRTFPWERKFDNETEKREVLLKFAEEYFEEKFIDCFPVAAPISKTIGYAFISLRSYSFNQEQQHAVYLNRMFLSGKSANILPDWVFFAKCIIASEDLRPTASRETFYDDEKLERTRRELGNCIISYFKELEQKDQKLLKTIINYHETAIKLAAISHDAFFRQIHRFINFQTSSETQTLGDILKRKLPLRYILNVDEFRKFAGVASNLSVEIINAGYVYDAAFFDKLAELYPHYEMQEFDAEELMMEMQDLELEERNQCFAFIKRSDQLLQEYDCSVEIKKFNPANLPALYFRNAEMDQLRNMQKSKDVANDLWGGILDNISQFAYKEAYAKLCFNYNNPLVKKVAELNSRETETVLVRMLYVQSLLLGRHSLQQKELSLLTNGLGYLIEKLTSNNG